MVPDFDDVLRRLSPPLPAYQYHAHCKNQAHDSHSIYILIFTTPPLSTAITIALHQDYGAGLLSSFGEMEWACADEPTEKCRYARQFPWLVYPLTSCSVYWLVDQSVGELTLALDPCVLMCSEKGGVASSYPDLKKV